MLGNVLLLMIILICIPLTVPKILGYEPYTIISGSMAPAIPTGSLVYIHNAVPEEIEIGDVIAYYGSRDEDAVVVHRVLEKDDKTFVTKGDANETEDLRPVAYDQLIGIVSVSVPKAGIIAQVLTEGNGKTLAVMTVVLAIILHLLAMAFERKQEE